MKNILRKSLYSAVGVALVAQNTISNATIDLGGSKPQQLAGSGETADQAVMKLVGNLATFLSLVAVLYALWGGFQILTAGGEDDKVKKGKTILIQALLGLVVIWLAYSVVSWLVTLILV